MKKVMFFLGSIGLLISLSSCGAMGTFRANNITNVELSQPNFNIVARNVQGSSMQGYLIGISAPQGSDIGSFGLIRISGVEQPYDTAVKNLWKEFQNNHGDIEGRKVALINVRQDTEVLNTIIYTEAKYFISADVIEFVE